MAQNILASIKLAQAKSSESPEVKDLFSNNSQNESDEQLQQRDQKLGIAESNPLKQMIAEHREEEKQFLDQCFAKLKDLKEKNNQIDKALLQKDNEKEAALKQKHKVQEEQFAQKHRDQEAKIKDPALRLQVHKLNVQAEVLFGDLHDQQEKVLIAQDQAKEKALRDKHAAQEGKFRQQCIDKYNALKAKHRAQEEALRRKLFCQKHPNDSHCKSSSFSTSDVLGGQATELSSIDRVSGTANMGMGVGVILGALVIASGVASVVRRKMTA